MEGAPDIGAIPGPARGGNGAALFESAQRRASRRYLRLRRLWSVRRTLALGRPNTKISDVARANGFWHMGEFASAYRATFGETPTQTLARHG